jgi:hypothetical protein
LKGDAITITVDIRPEVQAELARQAAAQGRALEAYAAGLVEDAAHVPAIEPPPTAKHQTGQSLIDAFADIRRLLTDEDIDRMFTRDPSTARPVDLS